jgi:hypothetical protein
MIAYTWILIAFFALYFLVYLMTNRASDALQMLVSFFIFLPLFGRVLGWF